MITFLYPIIIPGFAYGPIVHHHSTIKGFRILVIQVFKKMRIQQIRDPSLPELEDLPESYKSKVCVDKHGFWQLIDNSSHR